MIKYEDFYTVLQISPLVLSFLHPALRLRAQGAAGGSVTKTSPQTCSSGRGQTAPGPAQLPGLDLLEVGVREGFSPEELITPWGAAALCWAQPRQSQPLL